MVVTLGAAEILEVIIWRSDRRGDGRGGLPLAAIKRGDKNGGEKGASDISRLFGAAKVQSVPGADNPHCAIGGQIRCEGLPLTEG